MNVIKFPKIGEIIKEFFFSGYFPTYKNSKQLQRLSKEEGISLDEIVHDFSVLLQETTESSFSSLVVLLLTTICVSCIKLRRKRKIINQ